MSAAEPCEICDRTDCEREAAEAAFAELRHADTKRDATETALWLDREQRECKAHRVDWREAAMLARAERDEENATARAEIARLTGERDAALASAAMWRGTHPGCDYSGEERAVAKAEIARLTVERNALAAKNRQAGEWLTERAAQVEVLAKRVLDAEQPRQCGHEHSMPGGARIAYLVLCGDVVVLGTPPDDDSNEPAHNCDAMGCGLSHVVERYRAVPMDDASAEDRARHAETTLADCVVERDADRAVIALQREAVQSAVDDYNDTRAVAAAWAGEVADEYDALLGTLNAAIDFIESRGVVCAYCQDPVGRDGFPAHVAVCSAIEKSPIMVAMRLRAALSTDAGARVLAVVEAARGWRRSTGQAHREAACVLDRAIDALDAPPAKEPA